MADAQKIVIRQRTLTGKKVNRLRRGGVLPGVVFGGHKDSTPVETDLKEFERGYRRWGNTTLLSLEGLDGGGQAALIHDVSRSTLTGQLLHVDFQRVSLTEKVHAQVPIHGFVVPVDGSEADDHDGDAGDDHPHPVGQTRPHERLGHDQVVVHPQPLERDGALARHQRS